MPYGLEHWGDKAIVVNTQTGKHHSLQPISREKAEAQLRLLRGVEHGFKPTGKKKDPCWEGYEMIGMKTKKGRKVPNCVPEK